MAPLSNLTRRFEFLCCPSFFSFFRCLDATGTERTRPGLVALDPCDFFNVLRLRICMWYFSVDITSCASKFESILFVCVDKVPSVYTVYLKCLSSMSLLRVRFIAFQV